MKQFKAIFHGRVQGVGFRYTAERLARHFPVTGTVQNTQHGTVEIVAEGDEKILQDFLQAIQESPLSSNISDMNVNWGKAEGKWKSFGIKF